MTITRSWAMTSKPDPDLKTAHEKLARIQAESKTVIKIMTAEEALRAQRVVREAGRKRGR